MTDLKTADPERWIPQQLIQDGRFQNNSSKMADFRTDDTRWRTSEQLIQEPDFKRDDSRWRISKEFIQAGGFQDS